MKVHPFRSRAFEQCINPACPTNVEPDVEVGTCKACAETGREGKLVAHKSEKTGKRFIRCTNYEECGTSYPLPARGKLSATGEECPDCGAPMVVVETARGPWKLCPNMDCPGREKREAAKAARGAKKATGAKKDAEKKAPAKKAAAKKTTAKKTTAKKTTTKKSTAKKAAAKAE